MSITWVDVNLELNLIFSHKLKVVFYMCNSVGFSGITQVKHGEETTLLQPQINFVDQNQKLLRTS